MANLALVLRAVKAYRRSGIPVDDLVQEGNLGLIRAAQSFDPSTHTARFATYAGIWIRACLGRALGTNGPLIHVPERSHQLRLRYHRAIDELRQQAVTESDGVSPKLPTLEEIATYMGVTVHQLKNAGATRSDLVVDRILGEVPVADGPPPDVQVVNEEARARAVFGAAETTPVRGLGDPRALRAAGVFRRATRWRSFASAQNR